jgi:hypothetical protein
MENLCKMSVFMLRADIGQAPETDKLQIFHLRTDKIHVCMGNHGRTRRQDCWGGQIAVKPG